MFLNKLDDGNIDAVSTLNEYDMGYSMIEKLINRLANKEKISKEVVETFYLTASDMKNEKYIKILYPISG